MEDTDAALNAAAKRGTVASVDSESKSVYLPQQHTLTHEFTNLRQQVQHVSELTDEPRSKQRAGIGIIFQSVHPYGKEFEVVQTIEGSVVLPGDIIISIDSIEVFGFEMSKVADFLRGPEQSTVRLGLRRKMLTVHVDIKRTASALNAASRKVAALNAAVNTAPSILNASFTKPMTVKDVQPHAAQRDMAKHKQGIVGEPVAVCVIYGCAYSTDNSEHMLYTDEQVVTTKRYQGEIKSWWYWSDVVDSKVAGIGALLQPNKYSILTFVNIHPGVLYVRVSLIYIFVSPRHFAATMNKTK